MPNPGKIHETQVDTHHLFSIIKLPSIATYKGSCFCRNVWARYTCEADKVMQNDVEQFLQLRQGRNGPLRTFWYRARFQTGRHLIMRPLQLRHGECCAKGGSLSQWYYFLKKCPVACILWRHRQQRTKQDVSLYTLFSVLNGSLLRWVWQ